ncbi:MAG: hypothetical protein NT053_05415 [Cyanobacteria bacterium]|nr:hypothetical protein [Cyanobacteriota bacterium]
MAAAALSLWGTSAQAFTNLVQNASFEVNGGACQFQGTAFYGLVGPINNGPPACDSAFKNWTVTGLGASIANIRDNDNLSIWQALDSVIPPLTTSGTYYYQADGDVSGPCNASISQIINNLIPGNSYQLSFDWAAGSQFPYRPITSGWDVAFGNETDSVSVIVANPSTFSGWQSYSKIYTASTGSQILEFLSKGTPAGQPPLSLLDNVQVRDVSAVPGPLGVLGLATAFGYSRRLRQRIRRG